MASKSVPNPYLSNIRSSSVSEFTTFNPYAESVIVFGIPNKPLVTYVLPLPGPPAKKTAFKIPGSLTPSFIFSSCFLSILNVVTFLPFIVGIPWSSLPIDLTSTFLFLNLPVNIVSPTFTGIFISSRNGWVNHFTSLSIGLPSSTSPISRLILWAWIITIMSSSK